MLLLSLCCTGSSGPKVSFPAPQPARLAIVPWTDLFWSALASNWSVAEAEKSVALNGKSWLSGTAADTAQTQQHTEMIRAMSGPPMGPSLALRIEEVSPGWPQGLASALKQ
jgi:hypothetical protein